MQNEATSQIEVFLLASQATYFLFPFCPVSQMMTCRALVSCKLVAHSSPDLSTMMLISNMWLPYVR